MPMGPIELADQVGLDICLAVGDMLRSKFGDLLPPTPAWLRDKVAQRRTRPQDRQGLLCLEGRQGRQGAGLAQCGAADAGNDRPADPADVQRLRRLLREGIVDDADTVDGAMIFGTGYAPFRGGPLNYARSRGPEKVVEALRALAAKFGGRFTPDAGWDSFK